MWEVHSLPHQGEIPLLRRDSLINEIPALLGRYHYMLSTQQPNSNPLHRLARFVSKKAAAMMFNLEDEEDIYLVERWANVVYVRDNSHR